VLDLDLCAVHQPGFRPFLVRGESSAYWTVYDGAYEPVTVADAYLRRLRFGSGKALGTTRMYAGNLALYFEFCLASGRSPRRAALEFDRFVHYLAVTPIERRGRGAGGLRSPERVNHILGSVRELYREAVARGLLEGEVLQALFSGHSPPRSAAADRPRAAGASARRPLRPVPEAGRPAQAQRATLTASSPRTAPAIAREVNGLEGWVRAAALPSQEEIDRVRHLVGRIRETLGELPAEERAELETLLSAERANRSAILERLPSRHELNGLNVGATFDGAAG